MITKYGYFGDYNQLECDDGKILIVYPYSIDHPIVYHKKGFFLLKPSQVFEGEYVIVNYILDEQQSLTKQQEDDEDVSADQCV